MYSNTATRASCFVANLLWFTISVLSLLQNDSITALS